MLDFIEDGIRGMHVEATRTAFLEQFWHRREEFWSWQTETFGTRFRQDCMPVFLHGGNPQDRVLIMGINPGFQGALDRRIEQVVQADVARYVSLHEQFFDDYPAFQSETGGRSPFWNNLRSKLATMLPDQVLPAEKWLAYRTTCAVQDIIPFRSTHQSTSAGDLRPGTPLGRIANATFEGLRFSDARSVWLFSQEGYKAIEGASKVLAFLSEPQVFSVAGCTRSGVHRSVEALVVQLQREGGRPPLPLLAVDNALISQPAFPFGEVCCMRATCTPRRTMAEQLRARL